jgi:hypothetical protein
VETSEEKRRTKKKTRTKKTRTKKRRRRKANKALLLLPYRGHDSLVGVGCGLVAGCKTT